MNVVTVLGRIGKDIEVKDINGVPMAVFSLAEDTGRKDKEGNKITNWFDCQAWRKTAEFISQYFAKGDMIFIRGKMEQRKFQTQDGQNRTAWSLVVEDSRLAYRKREDNGDSTPAAEAPAAPAEPDPFGDE